MHIDGQDFRSYSQTAINRFRAQVANVLMLPPSAVIIAGIEPSCSLLITIMIPETYAELMHAMLKRGDSFHELEEVGVDYIMVEEEIFNIRAGDSNLERESTEQNVKLENVYKQLQDKVKQLNNADSKILRLRSQQRQADSTIWKLEEVEKSLNAIIKQRPRERQNVLRGEIEREKQNALEDFKECLKNVEENGYDKKVIKRLLEINSFIASEGTASLFEVKCQQLTTELQALQSEQVPLLMELEKYRLFEGNVDMRFQRNINVVMPMIYGSNVELKPEFCDVLRQTGSMLRSSEKEILLKEYNWTSDELALVMEKTPSRVLEMIVLKEIGRKGMTFDLGEFVKSRLKFVNREDVLRKYEELIKPILEANVSANASKQNPRTAGAASSENQDGKMMRVLLNTFDLVKDMHHRMLSNLSTFDLSSASSTNPIFKTVFMDKFCQKQTIPESADVSDAEKNDN